MSRTDGELYVCDACGATEAVLAYMKQESPLSQWAAFQPRRSESNLRMLPAGEAISEIFRTQTDALARLYRLCGTIRRTGSGTGWKRWKTARSDGTVAGAVSGEVHGGGRCGADSLQDRRRGQHPHGGGYRREVSRRQDAQRRIPQ